METFRIDEAEGNWRMWLSIQSDSMVRLTDVMEATPTATLLVDSTGRIALVNTHAERLFGYTKAELIGETMEVLVPPKYRDNHRSLRASYAEGRKTRLMGQFSGAVAMHKDGREFPVEVGLSPITANDAEFILTAVVDVSERVKQAESLRDYAEKLAASNRELDDFAYIVSHDLKEPLRGIHNFSSFLLADYSDKLDADGNRKLGTLMTLTSRLESLLDSLLFYSRVGRTELAKRETVMPDLLRDVLEPLNEFLREHDASVEVSADLPTVVCDPIRIGEVFRNLITNAVKYNDNPRKHVFVGWKHATNDCPVFFVRDNGIGIPKKHQEKVFTIFKRLHTREKYGGGTGSGLTIARKIIERHGGQIWLESEPGAGSTFYFTIKANPPNEDAA